MEEVQKDKSSPVRFDGYNYDNKGQNKITSI